MSVPSRKNKTGQVQTRHALSDTSTDCAAAAVAHWVVTLAWPQCVHGLCHPSLLHPVQALEHLPKAGALSRLLVPAGTDELTQLCWPQQWHVLTMTFGNLDGKRATGQ